MHIVQLTTKCDTELLLSMSLTLSLSLFKGLVVYSFWICQGSVQQVQLWLCSQRVESTPQRNPGGDNGCDWEEKLMTLPPPSNTQLPACQTHVYRDGRLLLKYLIRTFSYTRWKMAVSGHQCTRPCLDGSPSLAVAASAHMEWDLIIPLAMTESTFDYILSKAALIGSIQRPLSSSFGDNQGSCYFLLLAEAVDGSHHFINKSKQFCLYFLHFKLGDFQNWHMGYIQLGFISKTISKSF